MHLSWSGIIHSFRQTCTYKKYGLKYFGEDFYSCDKQSGIFTAYGEKVPTYDLAWFKPY
jgi:hypothetical protein